MKLERVLVVDTETQGLDPAKHRVIEVAGVLVDVEHAEVVACASSLLHAEENAAEEINQIPSSLLRKEPHIAYEAYGAGLVPPQAAWEPIYKLAQRADAFVAYRASFDRSFFPENLSRLSPWICSKFGVDWPRGRWGGHLTDLALAHGVAVTANHRALDDCLLVARVMARVGLLSNLDISFRDEYERSDCLETILLRGVERGVGEPNRCRHPFEKNVSGSWIPRGGEIASFKDQCTSWVRSYRSDVLYCPRHGGPEGWVS